MAELPPKQLLVEGPEDKYVFEQVMRYHGMPDDAFKVMVKQGVDQLLGSLKVLVLDLVDRVGVVIDADEHLNRRWQQVHGILTRSGYTSVPRRPDLAGTIIEEVDKPTVGVWIMPNNALPGKLEDFVRFLVPTGDALWAQAEGCVDTLPDVPTRFRFKDRSKAVVHTWLAWQREPGTSMGTAITKRYLNMAAPEAEKLTGWLHRLFD